MSMAMEKTTTERGGGEDEAEAAASAGPYPPLLSTHPFLEVTSKYHCRQRLHSLRFILDCLRIYQDAVS